MIVDLVTMGHYEVAARFKPMPNISKMLSRDRLMVTLSFIVWYWEYQDIRSSVLTDKTTPNSAVHRILNDGMSIERLYEVNKP